MKIENAKEKMLELLQHVYNQGYQDGLAAKGKGIPAQPSPAQDHGVQLVDLGLPSGTLWADRNVGASSPEQAGDYFRWGETKPFTEDSDEYEYRDLGENIAGTEHDAATANLGEEYKTPTHEQQKELMNCCTWKWTTLNGVNGMKVTGPNGNSIFFPASGSRYAGSGTILVVGSNGSYWSASASSTNNGRCLRFNSSPWGWYTGSRALAFPVRAVQ